MGISKLCGDQEVSLTSRKRTVLPCYKAHRAACSVYSKGHPDFHFLRSSARNVYMWLSAFVLNHCEVYGRWSLVLPKMLNLSVPLIYTKNFVVWMLKLNSWKVLSTQNHLGKHHLTKCWGSVVFMDDPTLHVSTLTFRNLSSTDGIVTELLIASVSKWEPYPQHRT